MFGLMGLNLSIESIINDMKEIINDKEEMERLTNGNGLSNKENTLLWLLEDLEHKTKFKKFTLNYFNNITFESGNRNFTLYLVDRYKKGKFDIMLKYQPKEDSRYESREDDSEICFDYNSLMKWFKKRNYLK